MIDVMMEAMAVDRGDPKRIQHFLKVYELARMIGILEGLDQSTQRILEAAAILHDIGIHNAEKKHHNSHGHFQEIEGPPVAREILERLGWEESDIQRICYLIGHHHTYTDIQGADYQILVEADFLVNLYEDQSPRATMENVYRNIFRTQSGKRLFDEMYN